jgi:prevent-host-death family protein
VRRVRAKGQGHASVSTLKLERTQMVSSTDMARRFAEYLDRVVKTSQPLYITRNNEFQAVLLSIDDYERLADFEEIIEHLTIARLVETRQNETEVVELEALLRKEGLDPDELRNVEPE